MTPEQIKRAKRLAEILEITTHDITDDCGDVVALAGDDGEWFYPEQDKALLWDLMFDYKFIVRSDALSKEEAAAKIIDRVIEINGGYDAVCN